MGAFCTLKPLDWEKQSNRLILRILKTPKVAYYLLLGPLLILLGHSLWSLYSLAYKRSVRVEFHWNQYRWYGLKPSRSLLQIVRRCGHPSEGLQSQRRADLWQNRLSVSFGYFWIPSRNTINRKLNHIKTSRRKNQPNRDSKFRYGTMEISQRLFVTLRTIKSK